MGRFLKGALFAGLALGTASPNLAAGADNAAAGAVEALQRRLIDAKCYRGPVDGARSGALDQAIALCPSQAPQLRIETGMHVSRITRIGVDDACRLAATGSIDKTVRLWSLPDSRLLRTLRVPIDTGAIGSVTAVAVSPDGRQVAVAARGPGDEGSLYIFNAADGAIVARLAGLGGSVVELEYSLDGKWLASAGARRGGLAIVDTSAWTIIAVDKSYGGGSAGAAFGPDGRLYTVAKDGKLRRYGAGPTFRKEQQVKLRMGRQPASLSIDAAGKAIVVGYEDVPRTDIYDPGTLAPRAFTDAPDIYPGAFAIVTWKGGGAEFIAGGRYDGGGNAIGSGDERSYVVRFDRKGKRVGDTLPLARDTVESMKRCGDGFAFAAADPVFGLVTGDGRTLVSKQSVQADMRGKTGDNFRISADARMVAFALGQDAAQPAVLDLGEATLADKAADGRTLATAIIEGLPILDWESSVWPTFKGRKLAIATDDRVHALALQPNRAGFFLGADFQLYAFDGKGKLLWKRPGPAAADGLNVSADGRIVVVAYGDGTIRWQRASDGEELLATFVNRDTKAWVAWTPSGYYMASPGGEDMIGWHLNRGLEQPADFFPASRFRSKFSRPDVVKLVLDTLDEGKALEQADAAGKRHADTKALIERLPPVLTVVSPRDGSTVAPGTVEIRYAVRSPSGAKIDRVEVFVDGAKVGARGLARFDPDAAASAAGTEGSVSVPMPAHDAAIGMVAYAGDLAGEPARLQLKSKPVATPTPGTAAADALKPSLYALLVGVSHYDNAALDLAYAADDATGLAASLLAQKGKLYKDVQVKVLTDKQATAVGFKEGLQWLQEQTTSRDLAIVFAAGHGITDPKGTFWFMTADGNERRLTTTAVSRSDITSVLYDLPGKKLLFLDSCHSGAAINGGARGLARMDMSTAVNDFATAESGVVAYAASTGSELSFEQPEWGHGAFTKALIEAIGEGKADLLHDGTITTATLDAFVANRVKQLTSGRQHAVMTRPTTVPDFPVALTR